MKFLIVEPFGSSTGHTVNFTQALVDILSPRVDLTLWSTRELCDQIAGKVTKVPLIKHNCRKGLLLRLSIAKSLWRRDVDAFDAIFFSSFEELSMIVWGKKGWRKSSALITNNLTGLSNAKKILLKRSLANVSRAFMYSEKQKELLVEELGHPEGSCWVIPHYSVGCQRNVTLEDIQKRKEIVYIGNSGSDKRLDKFIDLIKMDNAQKHSYGLYGDLQLTEEIRSFLDQSNVTVVDRYLDRQEYFEILAKAKFVVLFYKKSFEYKVSGIFFDAVSCYTPVLGNNILSFTYYFARFGKIGEIVNLDRPGWENEFLSRDLDQNYSQFLANIRAMKKELGHDKLREALLRES